MSSIISRHADTPSPPAPIVRLKSLSVSVAKGCWSVLSIRNRRGSIRNDLATRDDVVARATNANGLLRSLDFRGRIPSVMFRSLSIPILFLRFAISLLGMHLGKWDCFIFAESVSK